MRGSLGIRKIFFTEEVLSLWHRLPKEVMDSLTLEVLKAGRGFEQPHVLEGVPAHSTSRLELDDL